METGIAEEISTLGQIVTFVEKMPQQEREGLLRTLRRKEAMKLAKEHDEHVRQFPRELTDEQIVDIVRSVRHELAEHDKDKDNS